MIEFVAAGSVNGAGYAPQSQGSGRMPGFGQLLTDEQIDGHHRVRAEPVDDLATTLLAISWEPELRGILIVIIAVGDAVGSVYLILATNLGARLGFLVALTGAGRVDVADGHRLVRSTASVCKGPEPSWDAVPGRTVLQDIGALYTAGVFDDRLEIPRGHAVPRAGRRSSTQQFVGRGLDAARRSPTPQFGQAASAAATFLEETETFAAGEFKAVNVFDIGGERYPKIGDVSTSSPSSTSRTTSSSRSRRSSRRATEPGRAPAAAEIDTTPPAPVRLHGPQPRHPAPAGVRADARRRHHVPRRCAGCCTAASASLRRQPQRATGPCGMIAMSRDWSTAMSQYLPVVVPAGAGRRVRRDQPRDVAPAGAEAAVGGQGGAVRVRHRAQPRAARALPGQLLRRGDAVHHVRHRDHLRVPVRGRPRRRSGAYGFVAIADLLGAVLPDLRLRGRPRRARLGSAAAHPRPRRRCRARSARSARSTTTIRRVGTEGRAARRAPEEAA